MTENGKKGNFTLYHQCTIRFLALLNPLSHKP